jgi:uncharacterized protein YkwD
MYSQFAMHNGIRELKVAPSALRLDWNNGLTMAARDHCLDQGTNARFGPMGSDYSQFNDRLARYGTAGEFIGESYSYGRTELDDIMTSLLLESPMFLYNPLENVLKPEYSHTGIWTCEH